MHWKFKNNKKPTVSGGPFGAEKYQLAFLYFNWLNETIAGQLKYEEEYLGSAKYLPIELHMVLTHVKMKGDFKRSLKTNFGVAVFSFKYAVGIHFGWKIFLIPPPPNNNRCFCIPSWRTFTNSGHLIDHR